MVPVAVACTCQMFVIGVLISLYAPVNPTFSGNSYLPSRSISKSLSFAVEPSVPPTVYENGGTLNPAIVARIPFSENGVVPSGIGVLKSTRAESRLIPPSTSPKPPPNPMIGVLIFASISSESRGVE